LAEIQAAQAEPEASKQAGASEPAIEPEEAKRWRADRAELLRLRGEVGQLRQQVRTTRAASGNVGASTEEIRPVESGGSAAGPAAPAGPVETFSAKGQVNLVHGHAALTGGWQTKPGRRVVVLVSPSSVEGAEGQVMIQSHWVEIPEELMAGFGLGELPSGAQAGSTMQTFSSGQTADLLKRLEGTPGVEVLARPRIMTGSGTAGMVSITESKAIAGQEYQIGPQVSVLPVLSSDGNSVDLTIDASLTQEAAK
jgi:hypothetical protein